MRNVTCSVLAFPMLLLCGQATAYPTSVSTRDFNNRLPTDDIVVITVHDKKATDILWFTSALGDKFQVWLIPYSVELRVSPPPNVPGFIHSGKFRFSSYDKLHDLDPGHYPLSQQPYDMKIYFNRDFTWIEVWRSDVFMTPVRSTVYFLGPDEITYEFYKDSPLASPLVRHANYDELKKDIQDNYANKYSPDVVGLINYRPEVKAAVVNAIWLFE